MRLHGLDALRGIAALCVVGLHAGAVFGEFPRWFAKGYLGVDFFLMLSGDPAWFAGALAILWWTKRPARLRSDRA